MPHDKSNLIQVLPANNSSKDLNDSGNLECIKINNNDYFSPERLNDN
jgi:hypothetical protein